MSCQKTVIERSTLAHCLVIILNEVKKVELCLLVCK